MYPQLKGLHQPRKQKVCRNSQNDDGYIYSIDTLLYVWYKITSLAYYQKQQNALEHEHREHFPATLHKFS